MVNEEPVIRPGAILLTLVLMGITTLFAGLCAAYIYTLISTGIEAPHPPLAFLVNIPVLYAATRVLRRARFSYEKRKVDILMKNLLTGLGLTLVFIALQVLGWVAFFRGIPMNYTQARSFLFVLSALHLLHVVAGLPFLSWFIWKYRGDMDLQLFSNRERLNYLKGLVRYWNYLDVLWILLVVILSIGYSLRWL